MGQLADQAARGVARQPRVGIERDHVAHAGRHAGGLSADVHEAGVGGAAQQPVELVELAALALPSHPLLLRLAPDPSPVQQEEAVARRRGSVALRFSRAIPRGRRVQQRLVVRGASAGGVGPVREQREMQVALGRGQVVDLEPLDLLLDGSACRQQRRHATRVRSRGGTPSRSARPGRIVAPHCGGHRAVDKGHRDVQCGAAARAAQRQPPGPAAAAAWRERCGEQHDRASRHRRQRREQPAWRERSREPAMPRQSRDQRPAGARDAR